MCAARPSSHLRPLIRLLLLTGLCTGCAAHRTPTVEERAESLLKEAATRTGDVALHCDPPDAEVSVNGVPQGLCTDYSGTPSGLVLGSGMHRIDVGKSGYVPYQTYYEASGARAVLRITLQPEAPSQGDER